MAIRVNITLGLLHYRSVHVDSAINRRNSRLGGTLDGRSANSIDDAAIVEEWRLNRIHEGNRAPATAPELDALARPDHGTGVLPYCGDRAYEHLGPGTAPHTLHEYASDKSGTKTYIFNGAGFRGEELNDDAAFTIFVCGASYAFGTGLDLTETWSHGLKNGLAADLGLDPVQVNVLNFSQSLASANYVTRTLLSQCTRHRPHLVVANYSDMSRAEAFLAGAPVGIVPYDFPWHRRLRVLRPGWRKRLFRLLPGLRDRTQAAQRLKLWHQYSGIYSRELGIVNMLTQILLLQSFCRARGIDCLISWVQHAILRSEEVRSNPAIAPLIELLDPTCFCPYSIVDPDIRTDDAADGIHPGTASNATFANRLRRTYLERRSISSRCVGDSGGERVGAFTEDALAGVSPQNCS